MSDYLLARIAHLLAGANWQRGGGKGPKPKPIKPPDGKPRQSRQDRGKDAARRLRNLGLIPGSPQPLTAQEQKLAQALQRAQANKPPEPGLN